MITNGPSLRYIRFLRKRFQRWRNSESPAAVLHWFRLSHVCYICYEIILKILTRYLDAIDKDTQEIARDDDETYTSLPDLAEDLPENSPRFIVLSHPIKTRDGLSKLPLVMVYWIPPTAGQRSKMMYAGAVEEFRQHAGVSCLLKVEDEDELISIPDQLQ